MKVQKTQIKLKTNEWSFKTRSEGRRMKIYIKLSKAESEQWKGIKNAVVGEQTMSDGEFAKIMLFRGVSNFMQELNAAVEKMSEEEKQEVLSEAGLESEIELDIPVVENEDSEDSEQQ